MGSVAEADPHYPRCRNCFYILNGLEAGSCPECGTPFDLSNAATYVTKPPFLWWKFWVPGLIGSAVMGLVLYAILVPISGWCWSTTLVLPFCIGALLGYSTTVRWAGGGLLALILLLFLAWGTFSLGITGAFCAMALLGVALGPILLGLIVGSAFRRLWNDRWNRSSRFPVIAALLLIPVIGAAWEGQRNRNIGIETLFTTMVFNAPANRAWDGVVFYEEVKIEPPLLLRLGLPRPLYTTGKSAHVGDIKVCVYSKGHLVKRITQAEHGRLLAFQVVQQRQIEDHDVRLTGGAFRFEPIDATHTRVTLSTSYEPLLTPRAVWRPFERLAVHALHGHVLAGMKIKAEQPPPAKAAP